MRFKPTHAKDFKVGQEVVAMTSPGVPCQCNSANSLSRPCRVTIVKVGSTRVYALMSGSNKPVPMAVPALYPNQMGLVAVPIEEAKALYAEKLRSYPRNGVRMRVREERVKELVSGL